MIVPTLPFRSSFCRSRHLRDESFFWPRGTGCFRIRFDQVFDGGRGEADMNHSATKDKPAAGIAAQPPATQMWTVIQKLAATRTAFALAKEQQSR
jgi:hypothetical protein